MTSAKGQAGDVPVRRFQVTVFLPEPIASLVQHVRSRYDPVMAGRIGPHVTLVYEVPGPTVLAERLIAACAAAPRFRLRLSGPRCWGNEPERGIYLSAEDTDRGIEGLRRQVIRPPFTEPANVVYQPHVTLVHPRTVTDEDCRRAWSEIAYWEAPSGTVVIDSVAVMGESDSGWAKIETYRLGRNQERTY